MIIKFNIGVFVFTQKIKVIKLGHHTPYLATLTSLRYQDRVRKTLTLTAYDGEMVMKFLNYE